MPDVTLFPCVELPPDRIRRVEIDGHPPIAIFNLAGSYYATADTCTHGDASLAEGDIAGGEIICPFHLGAFDIRTGAATVAPCAVALQTWVVRVEGDHVVLEL